MEFDQIAIKANKDFSIQRAFNLINSEWLTDIVYAKGVLLNETKYEPIENVAELRFNYHIFPGKEFELIHYSQGQNFLDEMWVGNLSHFGMHVVKIDDERDNLRDNGFKVIQEVVTISHQNVPNDKHYHYAIFYSPTMDFYWKLIERLDLPEWDIAKNELNARYRHDIF